MANYLSTAGVILLESYQLTDATQLELQTVQRKVTLLPYLKIYIIEYMITSPFTTYYFISTTITTINQSYYIKHILHIYSTIIMILRL